MTYQSEYELEELLIAQLKKQGYQKVVILDEDSLKDNFRKQLNKFNIEKLQGIELTDKEFNRIMIHLDGKSIFNSSKLFRDKFVLEREDGTSIYIEFFDSKNYHNNIFQVTNQVTMEKNIKIDMMLLFLLMDFQWFKLNLKEEGRTLRKHLIK